MVRCPQRPGTERLLLQWLPVWRRRCRCPEWLGGGSTCLGRVCNQLDIVLVKLVYVCVTCTINGQGALLFQLRAD